MKNPTYSKHVFVFKELYDIGKQFFPNVQQPKEIRMRESERLIKENPTRVPVVLEKCEGEAEKNTMAILEENKLIFSFDNNPIGYW